MDTDPIQVLPSFDFSRAKNALSDLMTRVVHEHRPSIVSRHRGKERMLLVRTDDLVRYLEAFQMELEIVEDGGEVTIAVPGLGVLGFGATREEALDDLVTELRLYARDFFERSSLYAATDRAAQAPWLLRFALTPFDRQRSLLDAAA